MKPKIKFIVQRRGISLPSFWQDWDAKPTERMAWVVVGAREDIDTREGRDPATYEYRVVKRQADMPDVVIERKAKQ